MRKIRDFFVESGKIVYVSSRQFFKSDHTLQATALTYYTLFAVVPILALLFGIAKGFSLDNKLKGLIAERFAEQQSVVEWMYKFADTTLRNADGGIIAGIGILVLFWTVLRLATYVENSFNQIWAVRKGRTFFRKVSDYLSVIIIAPILLVVMSSSTIFARKMLTDLTVSEAPITFLQRALEFGVGFLPFVMAWLLFVFIYIFIPNTKVKLGSAVFAAIFAAVLYQIAQMAYINIQLKLSSYNSIYGSFSALPLFLIWMQWSWIITLYGAEIAFVHQNFHTGQFGRNQAELSKSLRRKFIITICKIVIDRFEKEHDYFDEAEIAEKVNLPLVLVRNMLAEAVDCGLLQRVDIEQRAEFVFAPGLPTDKFTIIRAWEILDRAGLNELGNVQICEFVSVDKRIKEFMEHLTISMKRMLFNLMIHIQF